MRILSISTELENISLDSANKLGCLLLPLEVYLDNTRFGTTNKGLSHLQHILNKVLCLKHPLKSCSLGPRSP